eukprot:Nk52_evm15s273 gene=Nk52_evmTU15s273
MSGSVDAPGQGDHSQSDPVQMPHDVLVFVYGTLKTGFFNHNKYLKGREEGISEDGVANLVCGKAKTVHSYFLCVATPYHIPYLLEGKSDSARKKSIYGEIYSVDFKMLKRLDVLEGHPDYYRRKLIPIEVVTPATATGSDFQAGANMDCFCYIMENYSPAFEEAQMSIQDYDADLHSLYIPKAGRPDGYKEIIAKSLNPF